MAQRIGRHQNGVRQLIFHVADVRVQAADEHDGDLDRAHEQEDQPDAPPRSRAEDLADPAIFSEVCAVICDAVYDMLYNDGFLDLPSDWRRRLVAGD